jgi:hypothetical protein
MTAIIKYSQAYGENTAEKTYAVKIYGCEPFHSTSYCTPSPSKFNSFEIRNVSSFVYAATNNKPILVNGKFGMALKLFANHLESVEIPNKNDINPNVFSVSFWVKGIPDPSMDGTVLSHYSVNTNSGWFFDSFKIQNSSDQSLRFAVSNNKSNLFYTNAVQISSNNFTHIVGTFDGLYISIYKNGNLVDKTKFNGTYIPDPKVPLRIGGDAYGVPSKPWSGVIDDFQLYNISLSNTQIKDLFNNKLHINNSLIGMWNFDGSLQDSSGNNNNGRLVTLISSMAFAPDGRLFFSEKNTGNIRIMKNDKVLSTPFVTISNYHVDWEQGLLGLTIDPNFLNNHYLYLYYTYMDNETGKPSNKVVRFTENNNKSTEMKVILDKIPASSEGIHSGGALAFGKDDKLYITVGDAGEPVWAVQQNISSFLGKVLRLNKDGTIPADNPFPGSPVFNIGHRNMYGIAFDKTGFGIVTENGASFFDEINSVNKGNYGYRIYQPPDKSPELSESSIKPLRSYWKIIAPTQAIYYQGPIKELDGKFLFGSDMGGQIYALRLDDGNKTVEEEEKIQLKHYPYSPVIAISESPNGEIYYGGYEIYKLNKVVTTPKKPILSFIELTSGYNVNVESIYINPIQKKISISFNPYTRTNDTSSPYPLLTLKIPKDLIEQISSVSATYNQIEQNLAFNVSENKTFFNLIIANTLSDSKPPTVKITSPPYPATTIAHSSPTKTIIVNGTAFDTGSGIQKVEGFSHTLPFDNKFPFTVATPISPGNWTKWSIPLNITSPGNHRILIQATDNAGNQNWDEVTVNIPSIPFTMDKLKSDSRPPTVKITSPP